MRRRTAGWVAGWTVLAATAGASAAPHEVRVPLRDGRLSMDDLLAHVHLPAAVAARLPHGSVDFRGVGSSIWVAALDQALGEGCHVEVTPGALVVHVDADKLPADLDGTERAVRTFTAVSAPEATAAQARRFGLMLPSSLDPARPLVVLVHGLDMTPADLSGITARLVTSGYQTAAFDYPPDGPIADDVALFTRHLLALREAFPGLKLELVAYSMGGLVARGYVEGDAYAGGVDRLLMIATPNHGSAWAKLEAVPKFRLVAEQAMNDPHWSPTWAITGGLGEAGRDLQPGSRFLANLNSRPRRDGVRYTVIDGDETAIRRVTANLIKAPARWLPRSVRKWWGVREATAELNAAAADVARKAGPGDGPVSLASGALDGVTDVVTVHADHATIYRSDGDRPPAAWAPVRDRLPAP